MVTVLVPTLPMVVMMLKVTLAMATAALVPPMTRMKVMMLPMVPHHPHHCYYYYCLLWRRLVTPVRFPYLLYSLLLTCWMYLDTTVNLYHCELVPL
jgi:hypothetical protein